MIISKLQTGLVCRPGGLIYGLIYWCYHGRSDIRLFYNFDTRITRFMRVYVTFLYVFRFNFATYPFVMHELPQRSQQFNCYGLEDRIIYYAEVVQSLAYNTSYTLNHINNCRLYLLFLTIINYLQP